MKKRIISMLLSVLLVMSLFSGITASASAITLSSGANVIEYTMAQGDYVLRICQRLGLNYYTCKQAIMTLNNINDGQWNKLAVGRTLLLPASDYDALLITQGTATTGITTGTATTGTATTGTITGTATTGTLSTGVSSTTTYASSGSSQDVLGFYLVPYTMSYGETVAGVCSNLGVNFNVFSGFIKELNGISSWSKVRAGDTLIVPTTVCPAVGTTCYGVMVHKVVNKDTAYSIVTSNGLNYYSTEKMLKALNPDRDLNALKVGEIFLYPKPMSVAVPGTGNPGSTVTESTTTTKTDGNGTSTTTTTTTSKLYKLTSSMSSSDGQMFFYVDNAIVTAAPAGAKVTVVSETESHKAVSGLTVKYANGQADLRLTGDTFIMPSCDVRVDALIKTGHDIKVTANYSGKAAVAVGGVSVQSAVKGAAVVVRSTDPNYEIQSIDAYYMKQISSDNKTKLAVSASNAFLMPDTDVYVEVTLKPVSTFSFYMNEPTPAFGSYYLQVDGNSVTRAAKGAKVTVVTQALEGYEPIALTVFQHGTTNPVNVFSNTFTMPGFDVDVSVTFGAKGNNIIIMPANGGTVTSNPADEAPTGATVTLTAVPDAGYVIDPTNPYDIVRNSDGLKVTMASATTFVMPKGGVTITPNFRGTQHVITSNLFVDGTSVGATYKNVSFTATISRGSQSFKGEFTLAGQTSDDAVTARRQLNNNVFYGDYIDLRYDCNEKIAFIRFEVTGTGADPEGVEQANTQINQHGYFQMPNDDITISAFFEQGMVAIGQYSVVKGVGDVNYMVNGAVAPGAANFLAGATSAAACMPGDTVRLTPKAGLGHRFTGTNTNFADRIIVTRKDNGALVALTPVQYTDASGNNVWGYDFTMPAEGVYIQVAFDSLPYVLSMRAVDEAGNNLNGQGLWQIAINGAVGAVDNDPTPPTIVNVEYGDVVVVGMTESGISEYEMIGFRIDGREYIADVKNYFYNFRMIDERAKDLDIVAILRPKLPYSPALYALNAYYDSSKGNVEFLLLDRNPLNWNQTSTTGYGNIGIGHYSTVLMDGTNNINPSSYEKAAIPGDYVAILVDSNNGQFNVTANDIVIYEMQGDSDRVIPATVTGWSIGGVAKTFFVFQMPQGPVAIQVKFTSAVYTMQVTVTDDFGNPVGQGFVQVDTGSNYRDVAADTTFDNLGYETPVRISRTEYARAQNWVITAVDVLKGTPTPTLSIPYNGNFEGGIWFTMPDDNVRVNVTVEQQKAPVVVNYNVLDTASNPLAASVFINNTVRTGPNGSFEAYEGDAIRISSAEAGYAVVSATDFIVPAGGLTLNITLAPNGNRLTVVSATGGVTPSFAADDGTNPINVNNVATGSLVNVNVSDSGKYIPTSVVATDMNGAYLAEGTNSVTITNMPAGGAKVTVNYKVRDINLTINYTGTGTLLYSINGATPAELTGGSGTIAVKVDDRITYAVKDNVAQITSAVPTVGTATTDIYVVANTTGDPGLITLALS